MSINKVILVGNVGKDPEIRHLDNNLSVANFSLATSETYTNKNGEKVTQTEWHNIVLWRKLAEFAEKYVRKGRQLYIEGRIRTRSYEKDGSIRYVTDIYGDQIQLLGRREDNENGADQSKGYSNQQPQKVSEPQSPALEKPTEEDDLPF